MDKALQNFEDLVKRGIAPSMTFFVLWAAAEMIRGWLTGRSLVSLLVRDRLTTLRPGEILVEEWIPFLEVMARSPVAFTILAILAIVGLSYLLAAAQQLLFDSWLHGDFTFWAGREEEVVEELRNRVIRRLKREPSLHRFHDLGLGPDDRPTDYVLYEVLGGIDTISTRAYVDSAKAMGIGAASVMLLSIAYLVVFAGDLPWWGLLLLIGLAALAFGVGLWSTCAQYRSRAIRLYVNFLAFDSDFIRRKLRRADWPPKAEP